MDQKELRFTPNRRPKLETRADGKRILTGYAAVFYRADDPGTEYELYPGLCERIAPGAFTRALQEKQDVVCRVDHEEPIGRSTSGTLKLREDSVGLYYECELPDTQCGRDSATLIERGDITGSSFMFRAKITEWTDEGDCQIRLVKDCDLFDVGPVVFPAYTSTSAGIRSSHEESVKAILEERNADKLARQREADEVEMRYQMARLDD